MEICKEIFAEEGKEKHASCYVSKKDRPFYEIVDLSDETTLIAYYVVFMRHVRMACSAASCLRVSDLC
jgi:hypothetical protein